MKLNTALTAHFAKLGIQDAELQTILGNPALAAIEVPEGLSTKLNTEFFTKEAALQNPEIRSTLVAETLNGVDAQAKEIMTKYELPAEKAAAILAEKKTSKRLSMIADEIVELTKEKNKSTGADKDALNKQISDLNKQILDIKTSHESELKNERLALQNAKTDWELNSIYSQFDFANKEIPKNISVVSAKAVINELAAAKGLKFVGTEKGLSIKTKEDTDYFENNVSVSPSDWIKKNLIENKMIAVTPPASQQQRQTSGGNTQTRQYNNSNFNSAIDSMIEGSKQ